MKTIKKNSGFGLAEVLITTITVAVGLLAVAALQGDLIGNSRANKARIEAKTLCDSKIEQLRGSIEKGLSDGTATIGQYNAITTPASPESITGKSETFARTWTITDLPDATSAVAADTAGPPRKRIVATCSWGADAEDKIQLESIIAFSSIRNAMRLADTSTASAELENPSTNAGSSDEIHDRTDVPLSDLTPVSGETDLYDAGNSTDDAQLVVSNGTGSTQGSVVYRCPDNVTAASETQDKILPFRTDLGIYTRRVHYLPLDGTFKEAIELLERNCVKETITTTTGSGNNAVTTTKEVCSTNADGSIVYDSRNLCTRRIRYNGGIMLPIQGVVYSKVSTGSGQNKTLLSLKQETGTDLFTFNATESGSYCVFRPGVGSTSSAYICYVGGNCVNGMTRADGTIGGGTHKYDIDGNGNIVGTLSLTSADIASASTTIATTNIIPTECPYSTATSAPFYPTSVYQKVGPGGWRGKVGLLGIVAQDRNVCMGEELISVTAQTALDYTLDTAREYFALRFDSSQVVSGVDDGYTHEGINKPYECHNFAIIDGQSTTKAVHDECIAEAGPSSTSPLKLASKLIHRLGTGLDSAGTAPVNIYTPTNADFNGTSASLPNVTILTADTNSCVQDTNVCTTPWGVSVANGSNIQAFQAGTVPNGQTCVSEQRTCTNGNLSGTYSHEACTVLDTTSCQTPWGTAISNNDHITAYQALFVPYGSQCVSEDQTCTDGVLSPTNYAYKDCSVQVAANCTTPWLTTVLHTESVNAYSVDAVTYPSTCPTAVSRTCTDGVLSNAGNYASCAVQCPVTITGVRTSDDTVAIGNTACTLTNTNGNPKVYYYSCSTTGSEGLPVTLTKTTTTGSGNNATTTTTTYPVTVSSCATTTYNYNVTGSNTLFNLTATAGTGGTLQGTSGTSCGANCTSYLDGNSVDITATPDFGYTFGSWTGCDSVSGNVCTVVMSSAKSVNATFTPASCTSPWGGAAIASGSSITAYSSASVVSPATCASEQRVCTNGVLDGSYTLETASCTVLPPTCTVPNIVGMSKTAATTALTNAGLTTGGITTGTTAGQVSAQTPTAGSSVTCSSAVDYAYLGATCTSPWGGTAINSGSSVNAYSASSVSFGSTCPTAVSRTCTDGVLSGSGDFESCTVAAPASCNVSPWGVIAHGSYVTAYSSAAVNYGSSCASETRTCSNGTLSGSYTLSTASCGVKPATPAPAWSVSGTPKTLSWSAISGATGYTLKTCVTTNKNSLTACTPSATSTQTGTSYAPAPGTKNTICVTVSANNAYGTGAASSVMCVYRPASGTAYTYQ